MLNNSILKLTFLPIKNINNTALNNKTQSLAMAKLIPKIVNGKTKEKPNNGVLISASELDN